MANDTVLEDHSPPSLTSPSTATAPSESALGSPFGILGTARSVYLLYVFLLFSRAHEFLFPIPKIAAVLGAGATFLSLTATGGLPLLKSKFTKHFALLWGVVCISAVFGLWQGGSAKMVYRWLPYLLIFVAGVPVITSVGDMRKLVHTIAAATSFVAAGSLLFGGDVVERLSLGTETTISNPNDLATIVLFGVPCWTLLLVSSHRLAAKLVASGAIVAALVVVVKTGSRSGLVTVAVMLLSMVVLREPEKRLRTGLAVLVAASAVAIAAVVFAPGAVLARIQTLLPKGNVQRPVNIVNAREASARAEMSRARGSTSERLRLLRFGVMITLKHPLLGVGPGQFVTAVKDEFVAEGDRPRWKASHNSFTQMSAETGIPGLLLYTSILIMSFRRGRIVPSKDGTVSPDLAAAGYSLRLAVVSYAVASSFLSLAYLFYLPSLAVMASALEMERGRRPFAPRGGARPFERPSPPGSSRAMALRATLRYGRKANVNVDQP